MAEPPLHRRVEPLAARLSGVSVSAWPSAAMVSSSESVVPARQSQAYTSVRSAVESCMHI